MLHNLGYSVDKVTDKQLFMDRLKDTQYQFVIYEGRPFENAKCLISDLVKDTGAEPFVIVAEEEESGLDYCCSSLKEGCDISVVKEKLKHKD